MTKLRAFLQFLRGLSVYTFAFTVGAALVATAIVAWLILLLGYAPWPEAAALARVGALMWIALASLALIALVITFWTMGKIDVFSVTTPGGGGMSVDFKDEPEKTP